MKILRVRDCTTKLSTTSAMCTGLRQELSMRIIRLTSLKSLWSKMMQSLPSLTLQPTYGKRLYFWLKSKTQGVSLSSHSVNSHKESSIER